MECSSSWPENFSMNSRKQAVRELTEGREFTTQLQILIQNQKPLSDHGIVADAFVSKILGSIVKTLSILNSSESTGDMCESPVATSSPKSVDSDEKRKMPGMRDRRGGYKRRKSKDSCTKLTAKPVEDGFGWRKYGQKEILNAKHPRNYYRCTHKNDQGCQATKQIQKTDDEPPMYQTIYIGHHTCTDPLKPLQMILDHSPTTSPHNAFNFKSSSNFNTSKQDCHPLFASFPSFKLEPMDDHRMDTQYQSPLHDEYLSSDLGPFESPGPTSMLASSSSGSDHGDVISGVYSCTTSSTSMDLGLVVDKVNFDDDVFLNEFFEFN